MKVGDLVKVKHNGWYWQGRVQEIRLIPGKTVGRKERMVTARWVRPSGVYYMITPPSPLQFACNVSLVDPSWNPTGTKVEWSNP